MNKSIQGRVTADCDYRTLATAALRSRFLVDDLFAPGGLRMVRTDLDRALMGAAMPTDSPLQLPEGQLAARELGVINLGGAGVVTVDGAAHRLERLDGLYVGRGSKAVAFTSVDPGAPAALYLLSYPAHAAYPTVLVRAADAQCTELGDPLHANRRTLRRYIHPDGVASCQLVMGVTELAPGSVWNTFPPHTHDRRSEIYCYFDLPPQAMVMHFMGRGDETRHLVVRERQAVLSPSWSCHTGVGTAAYRFVWGMGGENQVFSDMDPIDPSIFA
jgi:4-deoxy-L-threo-5-hexosulose-uronate ketol-isomerase